MQLSFRNVDSEYLVWIKVLRKELGRSASSACNVQNLSVSPRQEIHQSFDQVYLGDLDAVVDSFPVSVVEEADLVYFRLLEGHSSAVVLIHSFDSGVHRAHPVERG